MLILLIDNYDSFTYNLVQRIGELRPHDPPPMKVVRNDRITVAEAAALNPTHLILSPGPCTPKESGICPDLIAHFQGLIPILGVCLGHQTIGDVHGMTVKRHHTPMHGKTSEIHHDAKGIYRGLSNPFIATRYHSLIVERDTIPPDFEVSAWTKDGEVMGMRWRGPETSRDRNAPNQSRDREGAGESNAANAQTQKRTNEGSASAARSPRPKAHSTRPPAPLDGVQFHPESFLTIEGPKLLANFLDFASPR